MSKIVLSGIKPTGIPHIGNYFGMIRQIVDMKATYAMVADYHTLNFIQNASKMRELTLEATVTLLACGLDPKETVIFRQSDVPAHTELTWIFDTITTVPYLMRAHAYKDAEAKGKEVSAGTFNYPVLMASDILLYDTDIVPVGADQKQHIEYARDIAQKFNSTFGETFKLPKEMIMDDVAVVPGIDGRKMSKSYGNTIELFDDKEAITKKVMAIVTDSEGDIPKNVYAIHTLLKPKGELDKFYEEHKGKYKPLKDALVEDLDAFIKPFREKRLELLKNPNYICEVLTEGNKKANERANETLLKVKKAIGIL